mmetsp:Transcript_61318/g.164323  ORF Transcript_61318/g.164323 Transcript_61318/m.164323 type:complete len:200 (+) Transcript_61318:2114-2713(+)
MPATTTSRMGWAWAAGGSSSAHRSSPRYCRASSAAHCSSRPPSVTSCWSCGSNSGQLPWGTSITAILDNTEAAIRLADLSLDCNASSTQLRTTAFTSSGMLPLHRSLLAAAAVALGACSAFLSMTPASWRATMGLDGCRSSWASSWKNAAGLEASPACSCCSAWACVAGWVADSSSMVSGSLCTMAAATAGAPAEADNA